MTGVDQVKPSTKSFLMLLAMLALGIALGASGTVLVRGRPPRPPISGRSDGGFVAHLEQTIQPSDSAQRAAIRPILEATDQRNRLEVDRSRGAMRENIDSMFVALSPLLESAQRDRLTALIQRVGRPGVHRTGHRGDPDEAR